MVARIPPEGNADAHGELSPELREAVEAILHDDPPSDWAQQTLDEARHKMGLS